MGLGLSLGREVGNDGVQSSYVLENGDFEIRAGSGTLQQVGTNSLSNAFSFETSGVQTIELSTFVSVPAITSGSLTAEYRFSFNILERTGNLGNISSESGANFIFAWSSTFSKSDYDSGSVNYYAGGDGTTAGNLTQGGSGLFVAKHTHSSWPTSLEFSFIWAGAPATRTLTISNFKVEQFILSVS